MRTGTTLLELVVALLLLGVLTGFALAPMGRMRDRAAVLAAREGFVAAVRDARAAAIERGGAAVLVRAAPASALVVAGADTVRAIRWADPTGGPGGAGVVLRIGSGAGTATLRFDAAGIGRFASVTVGFRQGREEVRASVASYGRVRRR